MKLHNVTQGSPEWLSLRANYFTASEAPAMMGASKYSTREQLLAQKKTGFTPDVDSAKQRIFKAGHDTEAEYRPHAEELIGDELYPCTGSLEVDGLNLLASFDGLTMDRKTGYEHKLFNIGIAESISQAEEPGPAYYWQLEQQLLVSGADRILFVTSDGSTEKVAKCWYSSKPERRAALIAGWKQFALDLAAYVPTEVIMPAVAAPHMNLPAVSIQVTGSIALVDNLEKFGTALTAYIANLNRQPETDQDFANLEDAVKRLKSAEEQLDAAESSALGQAESIDSMRRTVALHRETARSTRLLIDKLVKAEKENRRIKIVSDAVAALHTHMKALSERTRNHMPSVPNQFQDVIKGLKSLDSMKDKVAGELARCKIEANAIADRISFNLALLDDEVEFAFLFPDHGQIVLKAADDFKALVNSRISEHKAKKAREEEATRERIRAEEQAKAEREHAAKVESERIQREQAEQAQAARIREEQAAFDKQEREETERIAKLNTTMVVEAAPAITHEAAVAVMPVSVRQAMAPKPKNEPTLTLGTISNRLCFNVTSVFLASLGFEATTIKASKLFHEEDFPAICEAIKTHISEVQEQFEAVAA